MFLKTVLIFFCGEECCRAGACFNYTKTGWLDSLTFEDCFFKMFLLHAKHLHSKVILIGDNVTTHFTLSIIEARENNITFLTSPTNSTHLCQSLNVGFFKGLKSVYSNALMQWKLENPSKICSFKVTPSRNP